MNPDEDYAAAAICLTFEKNSLTIVKNRKHERIIGHRKEKY